MSEAATNYDYALLARAVKAWGRELGFQAVGIADTDLAAAEGRLAEWLAAGYHGEMDYMARHGSTRARPEVLRPGTLRVISARMNYKPRAADAWSVLGAPHKAYIARYATGRDYHKVLRRRLRELAGRIEREIGAFGHRVYTDSAPVMEWNWRQRAAWAGAASTRCCSHAMPVRIFSWAKSTPTCHCRPTRRSQIIAAVAASAWTFAPPAPSSRRTGSTQGAAFPISPSSSKALSRWNCAR
jgi:hypothetical protein